MRMYCSFPIKRLRYSNHALSHHFHPFSRSSFQQMDTDPPSHRRYMDGFDANKLFDVAMTKRSMFNTKRGCSEEWPRSFQNLVENPVNGIAGFEGWSAYEQIRCRDLVPALGGTQKTEDFFLELARMLVDYMCKQLDRNTKVLDFHHPHHLKEVLAHCMEVPAAGVSLEQILSDCKEMLKYGVRTGHPRFFNQLSSGLDLISVAGEWLTATVNTNMFTYEIAPTFTLMEKLILDHMISKIGWEAGDGIFGPGGTISNMYGLLLARYKHDPNTKTQGINQHKYVVFTSDHCHYSIQQAAAVSGIGTANVIAVETDSFGKMDTQCLEAHIIKVKTEGRTPLMVNATASTTVLGAFDPINAIADICEKYNLWLHVDAAWGGGYLLSRKHKYKLAGIERAQSVTWNPHKLMGQTLQCSAFLTTHVGLLNECNSMSAEYLFQPDKSYDPEYDTGDKSIQCGRRNDIFKLWLTWRSKGDLGYEEHINYVHSLSRYLLDKLRQAKDFQLVLNEPESTNVCFWYVPSSMAKLPLGRDRDQLLHKVAPRIKSAMMEAGSMMIGYQPLGNKPNFFRFVCANHAATNEDIDFLLEEIRRLGEVEDLANHSFKM